MMGRSKNVVIVGTPHGVNVAGKRSPDGRFREYAYGRRVALALVERLTALGYTAVTDWAAAVVPDEQKVELRMRCELVNAVCDAFGRDNCIYVSVHNNASGSGKSWMGARGWCVYTSRGQTKSDKLASCLYEAAKRHIPQDHKYALRSDYSDGDPDWESDFCVLKNTVCAAVLTENLFQDNEMDVEWLESEEGFEAIVSLHVEGIRSYLEG